MSLQKQALIDALANAFSGIAKKPDGTFPTAQEKAQSIADAIDAFVKSGSVSVTVNAQVAPGIPVITGMGPGSTSAPGTATQSITNGTIS